MDIGFHHFYSENNCIWNSTFIPNTTVYGTLKQSTHAWLCSYYGVLFMLFNLKFIFKTVLDTLKFNLITFGLTIKAYL